jgi:hypothetical protein
VTRAEPSSGRVHEVELTAVVETSAAIELEHRVELGLSELRLAVLGIVVGVGLSAAALGLAAGGWAWGLVAGTGSVVAVGVVLRTRRLRRPAMRLARWLALE